METNESEADSIEFDMDSVSNLSVHEDYAESIHRYLREREVLLYDEVDCLSKQTEITDKFRGEMLEWMVSTQCKLCISDEALFLAFSIIVRYLKEKPATQYEFLMLCVSSFTVASKCCERYAPPLKDFVAAINGLIPKSEVVKMELVILKTLDYDILFPTVFDFLQKFATITGAEEQVCNLALYLCESLAMNLEMAKHAPSLLAASGFYLATKSLGKSILLLLEIDYSEGEMQQCAKEMLQCMMLKKGKVSPVVRKKYKEIVDIVLDEKLLAMEHNQE